VTRGQLCEFGLSAKAVEHRIGRGHLRPLFAGVYSVGRSGLTQHGYWMAAVLSCGTGAALSHRSAGALWGVSRAGRLIEVSAPTLRSRRGILLHRRKRIEITEHEGIPVTSPATTLVDLATCLNEHALEAAVNEADKLGLVSADDLRAALGQLSRRPGLRALKNLLDKYSFVLTDSDLERRFLRIARDTGLPTPRTGTCVNGFKVDFYWPDLGLVVETDGLRYHRTPAQQARDRVRDQAHASAGLTPLRFTRAQVRFDSESVQSVLAAVVRRLVRSSQTNGATDALRGRG
jgi:very-short-patch-repair endonuclease